MSAVEEENVDVASNAHLKLLREEKFCDVVFLVGHDEQRVQCHRLLLAARSKVFEVMFSLPWTDGKEQIEEKIPDTDVETFDSFLKFVYADKFEGKVLDIIRLLHLGHKYDVQALVTKCDAFLCQNFGLEDCIEVYQAARLYCRENLMEQVEDYMARIFVSLSSTKNFNRIDEETLLTLLRRDDLMIKECDLFNVVVAWGRARMEENGKRGKSFTSVLKKVLPLVRFPTMSLEEVASTVRPLKLLSDAHMLDIFTYLGSKDDVRKKLTKSMPYSTVIRKYGAMSLCFYSSFKRQYKGGRRSISKSDSFYENVSFTVSSSNTSASAGVATQPQLSGVFLQWPKLVDGSGRECNKGVTAAFTVCIKTGSCSYGYDECYSGYSSVFRTTLLSASTNVNVGDDVSQMVIQQPIPLTSSGRYSIEIWVKNVATGIIYHSCDNEQFKSSDQSSVKGMNLYLQNGRYNTCPGANSGELHFIRGIQVIWA